MNEAAIARLRWLNHELERVMREAAELAKEREWIETELQFYPQHQIQLRPSAQGTEVQILWRMAAEV